MFKCLIYPIPFQQNKLIHPSSRLQYVNTKKTSPIEFTRPFIIEPQYCERRLQNFDPPHIRSLSVRLYAATHQLILVPIDYLRGIEGDTTNCTYGHTFNLLCRDWINGKLANREPLQVEKDLLNHLLAMQSHCKVDLQPRALAARLPRDRKFPEFF